MKINVLWAHEHPEMSEMKKRPYNTFKEEEKPREKTHRNDDAN